MEAKPCSLITSGEGDKEESKEPDYDEDEDQLEEEQEEKTGEITTINKAFWTMQFTGLLH